LIGGSTGTGLGLTSASPAETIRVSEPVDQPGSARRAAIAKVARANSSGRNKSVQGLKVLLCDEHYKHTLGVVRHLGRSGARVSVVATSKDSLACRSRHCSEVIPAESGSPDHLVEASLRVVKSRSFDVVIPISYAMTLAMARRREEFLPHTALELAEVNRIECAADKRQMAHLAEHIGVPVPKTILASELANHGHGLLYPVVVKPACETPGRPPVRYANSREELADILAADRSNRVNGSAPDLLLQEFIPGFGCGFFATYQRGICRRVFMHKRIREYPATGGVSTCAESFYDKALEIAGRQMLDALNWHGVAMVEFRRDLRDGRYKLIEVNPKFWGSLDLALAAGADFPGDICRMATGENLPFSGEYRRNLRFHWPLSGHGDMFHLWTRPRSAAQVMLDLANPWVQSNVWLSDLSPNLSEAKSVVSRLFRAKKV
jgi:predicted ATP-grasp superfamily ATP-dependent carboligase